MILGDRDSIQTGKSSGRKSSSSIAISYLGAIEDWQNGSGKHICGSFYETRTQLSCDKICVPVSVSVKSTGLTEETGVYNKQ